MSDKTAIEWTEATWNPVTGCDRVSEGCDRCYAQTLAKRLKAMGNQRYQRDGDPDTSGPGFGVTLHPDQLSLPARWRQPRVVFVNSMSDLFHPDVPDAFIRQVFATMGKARQHTFQVLTKRPGRMASLLSREIVGEYLGSLGPLPNVWLGTSVENQKWADVRIPQLLRTPAAVRFLSCEPLLGPTNISDRLLASCEGGCECLRSDDANRRECACGGSCQTAEFGDRRRLDWVIVGGESGAGARPMHPEWARDLRDQCVDAGVPFFFKQWGGRTPKAGGRELDNRTWDEMPATARELVVQ
ncbi:MAG: hypothetical protein QOE83_15 [Actinomycetota bacterium]|nr:hypothetical protein [Actinomycetota bacterium]